RRIFLLISNPALERAVSSTLQFLDLHVVSVPIDQFERAQPGQFEQSNQPEQSDLLLVDDAALDRLNKQGLEWMKSFIRVLSRPPILLTYPVHATEYECFLSIGIEPVVINKPLTMKELVQALVCEQTYELKLKPAVVPCQAEGPSHLDNMNNMNNMESMKNTNIESGVKPTLRILTADDNRGNQMLIRTFLKKFDLKADFAENGADALQMARETVYDLVFMDVNMPVMDGLEATRRIRVEVAAGRQPWIVAITANVAAEDRLRCTDAGMNDFLEKPFTRASFQRVLATVGEHKQAAVKTG
ncbi:MAG: response regulator, partial [Candidatus Electrothrix sp. GM3_4]|nr:response regulator [Candidatus Electrothrix sp. GM3_4]